MIELDSLGSRHIYLQLLYTRWYARMTRMGAFTDRVSAADRQMPEELRRLPEQLPLYQKQIQRFFELVLDVDSAGRDPQRCFAWIRAGRISDTDFILGARRPER